MALIVYLLVLCEVMFIVCGLLFDERCVYDCCGFVVVGCCCCLVFVDSLLLCVDI